MSRDDYFVVLFVVLSGWVELLEPESDDCLALAPLVVSVLLPVPLLLDVAEPADAPLVDVEGDVLELVEGEALLVEDDGEVVLVEDDGEVLLVEDDGEVVLVEDDGEVLLLVEEGDVPLLEPFVVSVLVELDEDGEVERLPDIEPEVLLLEELGAVPGVVALSDEDEDDEEPGATFTSRLFEVLLEDDEGELEVLPLAPGVVTLRLLLVEELLEPGVVLTPGATMTPLPTVVSVVVTLLPLAIGTLGMQPAGWVFAASMHFGSACVLLKVVMVSARAAPRAARVAAATRLRVKLLRGFMRVSSGAFTWGTGCWAPRRVPVLHLWSGWPTASWSGRTTR